MTARPPFLALLLLALPARADGPARDARGWLPGPVAANAPAVIAGLAPSERPKIELPRELLARIEGPTVLFYFSPTCPHCQAVAAEVVALDRRLAQRGASMIWIASGSASEADLQAFLAAHGVPGQPIHDRDRKIVSALGARSTPSALLVEPSDKKGKVSVIDVWYPYLPSYDGLIEGRVAGDPFVSFRPGSYRGDNHCGACHTVEQRSWGLTHHAVAWYTLEQRNKTDDPACTGCHVTGAGQPTGWDGDPRSPLTDVGCEACHGPGGPHDGQPTDARAACAGCHDPEHSIAFSVEKGLPLIDHFAAEALDDEAYRAQRLKLFQGELPRPLLAFAEGANLEAAACQSCHPAEHAAWAISAHASAMSSLDEDDARGKVACVRCHATAKRSGPPPAELADFHLLDGVGCASCHGPGEAHAAHPTADNIEGLGEDCPVCVIEAICTGCHTAEWDPGWDLEQRLPKAGHGRP